MEVKNWKVGNSENSESIVMDGSKLESWKGEHSESIVMDGVKTGKLETVKIPREHRDG